jgi:hypothetical protein
MQRKIHILYAFLFLFYPPICKGQDSLSFTGQASAWVLYNGGNDLPLYLGARYIPRLNYSLSLKHDYKIDFEASANINGNLGFKLSDSLSSSGKLKPYRFWVRYSSRQFELRAGLQKINFGSASLLRPLMWFDQVDPRDPLKLTDGVWGVLGRYYFLNNVNIWLWGLYGNDKPKGWETVGTKPYHPELGGRIQVPVPKGEAALSYHYRTANTADLEGINPAVSQAAENRIGLDFKLDMVAGFWFEGTWATKNKQIGIYANQEIFNAGIDYTFRTGNGLYVIYEQLLASADEKPFQFQNTTLLSLISFSYPVSMFDNVGAIIYYDWTNKSIYNFINWQKQFNNFTFYVMGFWNPENYRIPTHGSEQNLYAGKGFQLMLVWNH